MNNAKPKHFVATGYVVRGGKTLLLFHKKLQMWLPPGGHIEENETPEEALRREILEETGLKVKILSPRVAPNPPEPEVRYLHIPNHVQLEHIPGHEDHVDLVYFCRALDGEPVFSVREHEAMRWHGPADLKKPHVRTEVRRTGLEAIRYARGRVS
ncbi:MAG TPA: NUDIX domain-containing protein [Elusimicrobiota bacterium]|nr:NUDIX domain-containing protein [Elusimicrobiota bacterium]